MDNICFLLQARVGSVRLPQKMILPFYKHKNVLELIIEKLQNYFPKIQIILATSINKENDTLVSFAQRYNCKVFRGSEDDVLNRFIETANYFEIDHIIRVCADNPFLDVREIRKLINFVSNKENKYDYVSFLVNNTPSIKTHFGFWVEYVTKDALNRVVQFTSETFYHEHVTSYIYDNPEKFSIYFIMGNTLLQGRNDIRMTLDTIHDFNMLSLIYSELIQRDKDFGIPEIINYLDESPTLINGMEEQIKLNSK